MRRKQRDERHATEQEALAQSDFDGLEPTMELVPHGVAQVQAVPGATPVTSANPYLQIRGSGSLATPGATQPYTAMAYNPFPDLPAHIAEQIVPGLADRTGWALFQWMQDRHLIPVAGVLAGVGCGWGAAATEPNHPWFGGVGVALGIGGVLTYGGVHLIGALNSNEDIPVGVHIIGIGGVALTAFGVACITGLSFLSAGVTVLPLAAGYWAWFANRQSKIAGQRQFIVDYTTASTPAIVPMPGYAAAAPAVENVIPGQVLSHEETVVRRAFDGMGIALMDVYGFERIDNDSFAVTVVFAPASNVSPEAVIARKDILGSALGARQVIALTTQRGHELRLTVRYGEIDPLADDIAFPGPVVTSIREPIPIGESSDSTCSGLTLLGVHTIVGGATGGGKSVLVKVLVASIAKMNNAALWLFDLKPGRIELGIFEPIADRSARSLADAALMFDALIAVAKARGEYLASLRDETGKPVEKWDPDIHGPVIIVLIDELAELVRQGKKVRQGEYPERVMQSIKWVMTNFETVAQVYRALGIQLVVATQSPSSAVTSGQGKDAIDQFQNLVCVQTAKVSQTNIILGQGAHGDGFRANTDLYVPGMFYMKSPGMSVPVRHKAYRITNEQIVEIVNEYADKRPRLDDLSAEAAAAVLGKVGETPCTTPPPGGGGRGADVYDIPAPAAGRANLRAVPTYPDGAVVLEKHRPLWSLLDSVQFRRDGATVGQLQAAAARAGHENSSLAWVRDRCKEWREAEVVVWEREGQDIRYWRDDEAIAAERRKEA